jgi:osmotically-inducible protein OsmY
MRSDTDIQRDVQQELQWDADIDATDIAVSVKDGVVTLSGFVRSYTQKWQAERDAKRVSGVVAVANDIDVRLPLIHQRPDPEIARQIVDAIRHELPYSYDLVKIVVKNGRVTLEGDVEWQYQRERAEAVARRVRGVKGVTNDIRVKPQVQPTDIRRTIEEAFKRNAELDADRITVEASDGDIVLKGTVRSWAEREEAERAAWLAPGVRKVDNQITVSY